MPLLQKTWPQGGEVSSSGSQEGEKKEDGLPLLQAAGARCQGVFCPEGEEGEREEEASEETPGIASDF